MATQRYQPSGTWVPADTTQNHMQACGTTTADIVALSSTGNEDETLFLPRQQVNNFVQAVIDGKFASIGLHIS